MGMWSRSLGRLFAMRVTPVDTPDVKAFSIAAWRARILRLVLVATVLALVIAALVSARDLEAQNPGLLPGGTTGVVVVDLSLSIANEDYRTVRRAFRQLIAEKARIGLVVFSDVAYELLPPGTPASELEPVLRLLVPPRLGPPVNPWTVTFRAGTKISTALSLARDMLERDNVDPGAILLVSDLETAPDDVPALSRVVASLRRSSIDLRIVPVAPSTDAKLLFREFIEDGAFAVPSTGDGDLAPVDGTAGGHLPVALLLLGGLVFVVLAAHELFGGRLRLSDSKRALPAEMTL
jgi:hypothetical protein